MEWYQVHYRIGEQWLLLLVPGTLEPLKFNFETFARHRANALMESGMAVEAMVVKVVNAPFSELATQTRYDSKSFSVVLPVLV